MHYIYHLYKLFVKSLTTLGYFHGQTQYNIYNIYLGLKDVDILGGDIEALCYIYICHEPTLAGKANN